MCSTLQKVGGSTTKYATRTSIWLAEMHKARAQFREGAGVLFRAAMLKVEGGQGVSLRAGVLLEQAAYCFLRVSPPMLRKYGFHMVLAGNRYTVCSQVCVSYCVYIVCCNARRARVRSPCPEALIFLSMGTYNYSLEAQS